MDWVGPFQYWPPIYKTRCPNRLVLTSLARSAQCAGMDVLIISLHEGSHCM